MIILGAGMSGCLAAIMNGTSVVLEGSDSPPLNHSAVLRFRTNAISKATGIPFRKVLVRKAIYYAGSLHNSCTPSLANLYSKKVSGKILSRSIWELDAVERYVAPSNFHELLISMVGDRILYGHNIASISHDEISFYDNEKAAINRVNLPVISTLPMPVASAVSGVALDTELFQRQPITTARTRVEDCDVHQTIYYPSSETSLYRATITGNELILEFMNDAGAVNVDDAVTHEIVDSFGLSYGQIGNMEIGSQKYGKIAPVPDGIRKSFMFELTRRLGVYSLGRFAVWKNILLDDVYEDIFAIRRMLDQHHYDLQLGFC